MREPGTTTEGGEGIRTGTAGAAGMLALLLAAILILAGGLPAANGKPAKRNKGAVKIVSFSLGAKKPTQADLARGTLVQEVKFKTRGRSSGGAKISIQATVSVKQSWSKNTRAGSSKGRYVIGKGGVARVKVKLNPAALELVRNCGAPKVTVTVRLGDPIPGIDLTGIPRPKPKKTARTAAPQASRCAVPADVKAAVQKSKTDGCDFIAPAENICMAPFPNDFYTRKDQSSETGVRVDIDPNATPTDATGNHVAVGNLNQADGFSPGPLLTVRVPGLDNPEAFEQSDLVPLSEMSRAFEPDQAVVLIDAETGDRQLIWAELDSVPTDDSIRNLYIRPGKNLENGKRYIVALRNLKDAQGKTLRAPAGFRLYRDNRRTRDQAIESRRSKFESIFRTLGQEGIRRDSLYLAWDFTVASTENLTGRMTSIRDRAFAELGDTNLTDGIVQGEAPEVEIVSVFDDTTNDSLPEIDRRLWSGDRGPARNELVRIVEGRITVPCFLWRNADTPGCQTGSSFKLDADQKPIRGEGSTYQARFSCNIPLGVIGEGPGGEPVINKVKTSLYGHGLFGEHWEAPTSRNVRQLGFENDVMVCAADWIGMADEDVFGAAIPALGNLSKFNTLPDRLQQGFLNWLYLGRAIIHPDGLAAQDAFKVDPDGDGPQEAESVIDTSDLFYYGNSQGGIAGGALTAVATDFTRSVLYVGGINYSMLLSRSSHWRDFTPVLYLAYQDPRDYPIIFSIMQMLWDRGEPNGYANHMTNDPLPGTPEHTVMYSMAYGDFQVANVTTEVGARTIGAPLRLPTVAPERLSPGLIEPFYGHETLGDLAASADARNGNAFFVWDIGPKRQEGGRTKGVDPPPLTNLPPLTGSAGQDPHDYVIQNSPLIRKQIVDFLRGKEVTDPCTDTGTTPYCTADYQGMP